MQIHLFSAFQIFAEGKNSGNKMSNRTNYTDNILTVKNLLWYDRLTKFNSCRLFFAVINYVNRCAKLFLYTVSTVQPKKKKKTLRREFFFFFYRDSWNATQLELEINIDTILPRSHGNCHGNSSNRQNNNPNKKVPCEWE